MKSTSFSLFSPARPITFRLYAMARLEADRLLKMSNFIGRLLLVFSKVIVICVIDYFYVIDYSHVIDYSE